MKHTGSKFCSDCGTREGAGHFENCPILISFTDRQAEELENSKTNPYNKETQGRAGFNERNGVFLGSGSGESMKTELRKAAYTLYNQTGKSYWHHYKSWLRQTKRLGYAVMDRVNKRRYRSIETGVKIANKYAGFGRNIFKYPSSCEDIETKGGGHRKWGEYAEGPFTPINMKTCRPPAMGKCAICGCEAAPFFFISVERLNYFVWEPATETTIVSANPSEERKRQRKRKQADDGSRAGHWLKCTGVFSQSSETCYLQENWCYADDRSTQNKRVGSFGLEDSYNTPERAKRDENPWSWEFSYPKFFKTPNTTEEWKHMTGHFICMNDACQLISDWMDGNPRTLAGMPDGMIRLARPSRRSINAIPEEYRGAFVAARYLEFEAKYKDKVSWH